MLSIPGSIVKIGEAIWLRITIALFFYLTLSFGRMFVSVGANDHPLLTVVCGTVFDATVIIIFNLLYGQYSVGRDMNTLSCYGLLLHVIYLACYFLGVEFSEIHNTLSKGINGLIVLRCIFMTSKELFAPVSPIYQVKKFLLARQWFVNAYLNSLTVAIFVLCAIPLSIMIYIINTAEMRASGIALILFAFYVPFENAKRVADVTTTTQHVIPEAATESDAAEQDDIWLSVARGVYCFIALAAISVAHNIVDTETKFFNLGYAAGYEDAKSGATPKKETNFERALWCNMVRKQGQSNPPGLNCDAPQKK